MFKSMNMRSFATYFVFCWLMAIAFTAYPVHAEYTLVFPPIEDQRHLVFHGETSIALYL
jgi:uncharacterized membrane protein (DUF106 family)